MVSVGKLKAGQARYYLDQAEPHPSAAAAVASGAEDYYLGGVEAAGEWCGRGAASLDLESTVSPESFERLLTGRHPASDVTLRSIDDKGVTGFDVTFSAPKSVSLLFGLGSPAVQAVVREAHAAAVRDAFAYFEDAVAVARRGRGGRRRIAGHGLAGAAFLHRTSRAGDPQLHTHVVVANLVQGADGRWSALDGRLVYGHARTTGFLYQAALREQLSRRLGVRWREVRNGMAEIEGVPDRVLRAFSRRRAEIEAAMRLHGSAGRDAAQVATLATRRAKDRELQPGLLAPEWRARAAREGFPAARLEHLCRGSRAVPAPDWDEIEDRMASSEGLTRDRSTFGQREALQAVAGATRSGARVAEIRSRALGFLGSECAVALLATGERSLEPQYSTPELLVLETRIIDAARRLRGAGRGAVETAVVAASIDRRPHLAEEQRSMVTRLARDGDGVAVVIGRAGAGKTTALAAARDAWEAAGYPVRGCALARRAARELEKKAGIRATSVASTLRARRSLDAGTVLVVDEAAMLGTRDLAKLLALVEHAHGKLVLAGDPSQLPAIRAGGALASLATRLDPIVLRENRRQEHQWERDAVEAVRLGDAESAVSAYESHGRLVIGSEDDEVMGRLIADWSRFDDPAGAVMIAHRRSDVATLNARARAVMRSRARLGSDELLAAGGAFAAGDHVLVKRNDTACDVRNGDRGVVEAVDRIRGALHVRIDDHMTVLDAEFLSTATASGRPSLEHGYAITAYAAQGMTTRRALVLARDDSYREWIYTTMTRARESNRLYVIADRARERIEFAPSETAPSGRVLLATALTRTGADELALEQVRDSERSRSGIQT